MVESELFEFETVVRLLTLSITLLVFGVTLVAYYRSRIRRVLVLALLAALLATDLLLEVGEEFLEEGVPFFEELTAVFALGIALLLLATVVRRFDGRNR